MSMRPYGVSRTDAKNASDATTAQWAKKAATGTKFHRGGSRRRAGRAGRTTRSNFLRSFKKAARRDGRQACVDGMLMVGLEGA